MFPGCLGLVMNTLVMFAFLTACGIVWGATIPLTKIAVSTGHHPLGLLTVQLAVGSVLTLALVLYRRSRLILDRRHLIFFAIIGLTGTVLPNSVSYFTAAHLPAGVMALIIAMVPVFAFVIASIFRLEPFQMLRLAGVGLGALAIALLVLPESSLPDPSKAPIVLLALIAPFLYGVEGNYLSVRQPAGTGPFATLLGASVIGLLLVAPIAWSNGWMIDFRETFGKAEAALIASSIMHVAAYAGYIWLVERAGAVFTAQVAYMVTPAGVLLSVYFLGEELSSYIWASLAVLMVGLFLVQPRRSAA